MAIEPVGVAQESLGPIALHRPPDTPRGHDDNLVLSRPLEDGHYHEPARGPRAGFEHGADLPLEPELETGWVA